MVSSSKDSDLSQLLVDGRWKGGHGIGRFASEVLSRLGDYKTVPSEMPLFGVLDPLLLALLIKKVRPCVYFTPGFNPPAFNLVPTVLVVHDLIHLEFPEESSVLKRAYYRYVVRRAIRFAHRTLTVSEYSRREIVKWTGVDDARVVVVGNGVAPIFNPTGEVFRPGYRYLLYVGNHKPHKNVKRLVQSFSRANISKDIKLVMTGFPDSKLVVLISSLGVSERIVFAGAISELDLPRYYRGAEALIFPTLYEGFGLPVIEAMACGVPVLTSNTTSLPEVAASAALYCDPLSIDSISRGIETIIEDKNVRAQLRIFGLDRARLFSWDDVAFRVKAELDSAVGESSERQEAC